MAEILDDDGFSLKPKTLHKDAWFYEGKNGLTVFVHQIGTVDIPWSRLKPSIERFQKYTKRRAKPRKRR